MSITQENLDIKGFNNEKILSNNKTNISDKIIIPNYLIIY
jgi:hypothetical protein